MKALKILTAVSFMALNAQVAQAQDSTQTSNAPIASATQSSSVIIAKVNGLVCDFCAQALNKVFKKEAAFEALDINLDEGEVRITVKEGQTLTDETIKKLIRKSGYSLVSINRGTGA